MHKLIELMNKYLWIFSIKSYNNQYKENGENVYNYIVNVIEKKVFIYWKKH